MDKLIEDQLKKCVFADLSDYDEATHTYHIKKYAKPQYAIGKCYLVKISNSIVKNTDSVTATNWNHGTAPQMNGFKIYVSKMLGKMIYVDGLGVDLSTNTDTSYMWSGWLNIDDLTQIQCLG